jgi:hypothetical protein
VNRRRPNRSVVSQQCARGLSSLTVARVTKEYLGQHRRRTFDTGSIAHTGAAALTAVVFLPAMLTVLLLLVSNTFMLCAVAAAFWGRL